MSNVVSIVLVQEAELARPWVFTISYDLQADRLDLAPFDALNALYFQEECVTSKRMKRAER